MTCGFDEALSVMEMRPDFAPCDWGEKVTLMEQLAAGANGRWWNSF
jgi:hypothetical protein